MQVIHFKEQKQEGLTSLPPLSLYVHIPWCIRKCPYCDFNSHELRRGEYEAEYVAALIRDLETSLPLIWGRSVSSIFFGGGTPSLLSVSALETLLNTFSAYLRLQPELEITLEANPSTIEAEKFRQFRAAGVNRLSIGVQSFHDEALRVLGRVHSAAEARAAIEIAAQYFDNFNLDLMYALPHQTLDHALQDIDIAMNFSPKHLSAYHLTIEPNTQFGYLPPEGLPDDDQVILIQEAVEQALVQHGYVHYETAAFCKASYESRHNLNYWQFGDYLGIGAGAHGKLSFHDQIMRTSKEKSIAKYLNSIEKNTQNDHVRRLNRDDLVFEFMMNALRLREGFPAQLFSERTGLDVLTILPKLQDAEARGFLSYSEAWIRPTPLGQRFLNDVLVMFLND